MLREPQNRKKTLLRLSLQHRLCPGHAQEQTMQIDRNGNRIIVGFKPHELEYIAAANTLRATERTNALQDISAMTGHCIRSVHRQAAIMQSADRKQAKERLAVMCRMEWRAGA